jgi:hypothetical protein
MNLSDLNPLRPVIEGVVSLGGTLIDRLFPDKVLQAAERAKAELELQALVQSGQIQELATRMAAVVAEANSTDPWTSRARPSFLYVMYFMILMAVPMGILSAFSPDTATAIANGMGEWLQAIPGELYALFGVGYTGYTLMRTREKNAALEGAKGRLGIF